MAAKAPRSTTGVHVVKRTLVEYVDYPNRLNDRTTSPAFRKNRRHLIRQLGLGCFHCGSRDHLEVHHIHEWALWDALDPEKVLDNLHAFDPYGFTRNGPEHPPETPDDLRNLLVLCGHCEINGVEVPGGHHRGKDAGVHDVTFPIWFSIRAVKDGISITEAIQHVKRHDQKVRRLREKGK